MIVALGAFAAQDAAADAGPDLAAARPRLRLPRREADPDVPSVVPAPQPGPQARRLGGPEEGARAPRPGAAGAAHRPPSRRAMRLIRVAVPVPALEALTYRVPDELADPVGRRARPRAARQADAHRRVVVGSGTRVGTGSRGSRPSDPRDPARSSRTEPREPRSPSRAARRSRRSSTSSTTSRSCRPTSSRWRRGSPSTTRAAPARRSPPRCRRARGSRASGTRGSRTRGRRGCSPSEGVRREILEALTGGEARAGRCRRARSRGVARRARSGSSATAWSTITRPLKGKAAASRTVRVATLTAQGHDVAGRRGRPEPRTLGPA